MSWWQAIILGLVEGITEFLPVSSTGHLLIIQHLLGLAPQAGMTPEQAKQVKDAADAYAIVIQAGAILAVAGLYRHRMMQMMRGVMGKDAEGRMLAIHLFIAFVCTAGPALLLANPVKEYLFFPKPIAVACVVGGGAILIFTTLRPHRFGRSDVGLSLLQLTPAKAAFIGLMQIIALWPGTSRSLVTILAGMLVGMSVVSAIEFSFLLGVITLLAATLKDAKTHGGVMLSEYSVGIMLLGLVTAGVSAVLAVEWLVSYLKRHSLSVFGWYRMGLGAVMIVLIWAEWL